MTSSGWSGLPTLIVAVSKEGISERGGDVGDPVQTKANDDFEFIECAGDAFQLRRATGHEIQAPRRSTRATDLAQEPSRSPSKKK